MGVVTSTPSGEPLVLLDEGEDDGMQHLRALFQFSVLPADTGKFPIGVAMRTQAGLWTGRRWRHALFDPPSPNQEMPAMHQTSAGDHLVVEQSATQERLVDGRHHLFEGVGDLLFVEDLD